MVDRHFSRIAVLGLGIIICLGTVAQAQVEGETPPTMTPKEYVEAALRAEAEGNMARHDELLAFVAKRYPAYTPR